MLSLSLSPGQPERLFHLCQCLPLPDSIMQIKALEQDPGVFRQPQQDQKAPEVSSLEELRDSHAIGYCTQKWKDLGSDRAACLGRGSCPSR